MRVVFVAYAVTYTGAHLNWAASESCDASTVTDALPEPGQSQ